MAKFTKGLAPNFLGLLLMAALVLPATAGESAKKVNTGPDNVAIKGYDSVAYFTKGEPIKGKPEFAFSWHDAQWHFASAVHRDQFAADPQRYAPQFGGFCSMALTTGDIVVVDPEAWAIVDGKLYLSFSKRGIEKFRDNTAENIKKAEQAWEKKQKQR